MVFPLTHWFCWLPGWMHAVLRSSAARLDCVSEGKKNCQVWCSPGGGDSLPYVMQLVARYRLLLLIFIPPLFRDTLFNFC